MIKLNVTAIWATGYKRFVFIEFNDNKFCLRINNSLYDLLKQNGVPTLQSLRKKVLNGK